MRVTLITDASFCPDHKVAGYGYWVACQRGKKGGGGAMKGEVCNSSIAEMQAIVNGLHCALTSSLVQHGDEVLIQTDCTYAIMTLTQKKRKELTKEDRKVISALQLLTDRFNLALEFRHVKGHSTSTEARFVTNNLCDKRARKAMKLARNLKQLNKVKEILL